MKVGHHHHHHHHKLGLDRPVSASYNSLFKALPTLHRPYSLQFSIIFFGILLLFVLATCHS